jgi:synaptojanin
MNYRIDLDNDGVRNLALADELDSLLARDQVRRCLISTGSYG